MMQLYVVRLSVGKKSTDAENRSELLDGSPHDQSPRVRSTDSIKVKYGHKPSTVRPEMCLTYDIFSQYRVDVRVR